MKRLLISLVVVITLVSVTKQANAQTVTPFGHTTICGVSSVYKPPIQKTSDLRLPAWWISYDKTPCTIYMQAVTIPSIKLGGYCSPFPNKTSPVGETTAFCQGGSNEKVNAYVCNTGNTQAVSCGNPKITDRSGGSRVSLLDVKNKLGSEYKCGQTIQLDVFNKTCTNTMIDQHYRNISGLAVPSADLDGDGMQDQFDPKYYVKDASGVPTFCLAKDNLVWYTGACKEEKKNPSCVLNGSTSDMYVGDIRPFSAVSSDPDGGVTNLTQIYSSPTTSESWTYVGASNSNTASGNFLCPRKGSFYITCNARDDEGVFCSGNPFNDKYVDCGPNDTKVVNCIDRPVVTPNLSIDKYIDSSKTVGTSPYKTNDVIVFGITVKNTGNVNLVDIILTDTLPAYTEFDAEKTKALNGGILNWACIGTTCSYNRSLSLAVNESKTVYFAVKVKSYTTLGDIKSKNKVCANVKNVAEKCDEVPFDLRDVVVLKSIYIDKMIDAGNSIGTSPYKAGDLVAFKIRVQNTGNTALGNVILKDTVPALTTFSAADTNRLNATINVSRTWTCTAGVCQINLGTLAPTQIVDIFFVARVSTYERYGENVTSENKACVVTTSLAGEKCDEVPFDLKDLIAPVRAITIDKSIEGSANAYKAGDYVKFKVVVTNTGNTKLDNVIVEDVVPALTNFDAVKSAEANGGKNVWECADRVCNSYLGSLEAKASRTLYYVVKVQAYTLYGEDVKSQNTACVTANLITGKKCDTVPFDLVDVVEPSKSITIDKSIEGRASIYKIGDYVKFKIVVKNTGNTRLNNLIVEDEVPTYTDFDTTKTAEANGGANIWECSNRTCKSNIGTLNAGAEKTLYYVVKVQSYTEYNTDVKSKNTACVTTTDLTGKKCDDVDFDLEDQIKIGEGNISIDKVIDNDKTTASSPYEANAKVVFRITVKNTGETDLTNVVVTDNVPAHTDYDADATNALTSGWNCDGGTCTYTIGNFVKGAEKVLYYVVKVEDHNITDEDVKSENKACVKAKGDNSQNFEQCDEVTFDIKDKEEEKEDKEEGDKVSISKKVRKEGDDRWEDKITDVEEGDVIEFKIKVENKSDEDTSSIDDLKMEDKLPKELEKISGGLTEYWDDFDHDDDKTFIIKAKVRSSEYDKDVDKCVDNKARVFIDGDEEDEAEATVCYSNVEVSELPETGAGSFAVISGLITSAFGIVLKKKRA